MRSPASPPLSSAAKAVHPTANPLSERFAWTGLSPAVRHAQPVAGTACTLSESTRILIDDERIRPLATRLAFGLAVTACLSKPPAVTLASGSPRQSRGDVVLNLFAPDTAQVPIPAKGLNEAYRIDINDAIRVTAKTLEAMARALTTLHKAALVCATLDPGVVIDAPAFAERSVLLDVGRKYYSPEWIKNLLREMAWNQLNTLYLHLTDNEGVRIVFPSHPGLSSADAWSAEELKEILDTAASYHINVIPGIESPGHMKFILRNKPEFQLHLSDGTVVPNALDFSIPAARRFVRELLKDVFELFPDSTHVNLEADEYFLAPITSYNTPQLAEYARQASGKPGANSRDGVRQFINELAGFVRENGKTARMWNDAVVQDDQVIQVDKAVEILCWSIWGSLRSEKNVQALIDAGYSVINAHGDFYFVIRSDWSNLVDRKHSPHGLYDFWRPNHFMDKAGQSVTIIDSNHSAMKGAGIQVWADEPDHLSAEKIWSHLIPWMQPTGQRLWGSLHAANTMKEVKPITRSVAFAPPER